MLLRPRWLAGHILVIVLATLFIILGFWQYHRDHQKQAKVRADKAAYAAPAPELSGASDPPSGASAQATGTYDAAHEVLLPDQVRGNKLGTDVLTPMRLGDGTTVLVDRGWVPGVLADEAPTFAPAPAGPIQVRGIVVASRSLSPQDEVRTVGGHFSIPRVDTTAIGTRTGTAPLRPIWIEAHAQQPAPTADAPKLPQPPPPDQVNHMDYAIQWWAFALIPLIGWPIVLWQITRRRRSTPAV